MSFAADLDLATLLVTPERCLATAPLRAGGALAASGQASIGVLATLFDVGSSHPALIAVAPDWTATLDLSIHGAAWPSEGPIVVDSSLVRTGSRFVVVRAEIYDACGIHDVAALPDAIDGGTLDVVARGLITFARLPRRAATGVDDYDPSMWLGEVRHLPPERPVTGDVAGRMGVRTVDAVAGILELDRTPYVANSIGTINGGAQAILIELAAEAACPGFVAADVELRFLAQLREGPARTSCTVLRQGAEHAVVDVEVRDAGADVALTLATVTLRRPPRTDRGRSRP